MTIVLAFLAGLVLAFLLTQFVFAAGMMWKQWREKQKENK